MVDKRHAKPRILVVEDDPEELHELRVGLSDEFEVFAASNFSDAVRLMKDHLTKDPFEAFLFDVILPPDAEAAQRVKRLHAERNEKLGATLGDPGDTSIGLETKDGIGLSYEVLDMDTEIGKYLNERGAVDLVNEYCRLTGKRHDKKGRRDLCKVPTVYLTARELPALEREAIGSVETGKSIWLNKPERKETIRRALEMVLSRSNPL